MGIDLSDLVKGKDIILDDLKGKKVAIDGYNTLYQFLSSIRQPDGTPLKDLRGRVTSHLSGTFQRTANLLVAGIKPVYVFDGKPNPLKIGTLRLRRERKQKAREEWEDALKRGDLETARTKAQQTSKLTREMVEQAKVLLGHMGVPCVDAPEEGEAQASHMAAQGLVFAASSQDYDSLLFGAPRLVRNLTLAGRRKMPRRNAYVDILPEMLELDDILSRLDLSREQLVDMAVLMGTDFNEGVRGIGPKKALKLLKECGSGAKAIAAKDLDVPGFDNVREIFLEPRVTDIEDLPWGATDRAAIEEFLCGEHDFSRTRIQSTLEKITESEAKRAQRSLEDWF
jgi:flap endonuclease-1